jgi:hypothetical protein
LGFIAASSALRNIQHFTGLIRPALIWRNGPPIQQRAIAAAA